VNTARKGNGFDVVVAKQLEAEGWTVGSRRHLPGPGDLLACREGERPRLIECKRGARSPFENFRQVDRNEMRDYAAVRGLVAELAWRKDRGRLEFIDEASWP
jgi:hypothetical protein